MCLAVPMKILELSGNSARCERGGVQRTVSLFLLEPDSVTVGDFVMVHVGYAIERVDPDRATEARALADELQQASTGA
ncbi:MAG: HypC/HybG/HupF family hydrogenase formation chaperone [Halothiobacillaceae bacterium]